MSAMVDEYLETKVLTGTPYQLHLMVLDAAIRQATNAEEALVRGDVEKGHFALCEARRCLGELISGLDPARLPDVVERLRGLFLFVYRNFVAADMQHQAAPVGDALKILRLHRKTWLELGTRLRQEQLRQEPPQSVGAPAGYSWES